jgi:integrase
MAKAKTSSEIDYVRRGNQLLKRALKKFGDDGDAVDAYIKLCSDALWKLRSSTTRSYKAAMIAVIKQQVYAERLDRRRAAEGITEIARLLAARRGRPAPRTSAKKVIDLTEEEIQLITEDLRRRADGKDVLAATLRLLIIVMSRIGLRPSEFASARLFGRSLFVFNGKHSHGRAAGAVRRISLERMPDHLLKATQAILFKMKVLGMQYGSAARVQKVLAERLARICSRLGIVRVSLYGLRHVAIATWKRAGFDRTEIAALAGHISCKTAWRSYAGARSGWRPSLICVQPHARTVRRVTLHIGTHRRGWLPPAWAPPDDWSCEGPSFGPRM